MLNAGFGFSCKEQNRRRSGGKTIKGNGLARFCDTTDGTEDKFNIKLFNIRCASTTANF